MILAICFLLLDVVVCSLWDTRASFVEPQVAETAFDTFLVYAVFTFAKPFLTNVTGFLCSCTSHLVLWCWCSVHGVSIPTSRMADTLCTVQLLPKKRLVFSFVLTLQLPDQRGHNWNINIAKRLLNKRGQTNTSSLSIMKTEVLQSYWHRHLVFDQECPKLDSFKIFFFVFFFKDFVFF